MTINVETMYNLLCKHGFIQKLIVFRKKNFQVFVELESAEKAQIFKQSLSTADFGPNLSLKIQFTLKKELVVNQNTMMEFDFTRSDRDSYLEFSSQARALRTLSSSDFTSHLATPEQKVRGPFLAHDGSASSGFGYSPHCKIKSNMNRNLNNRTDMNNISRGFYTPNSGFGSIGIQEPKEIFSKSAKQEVKGGNNHKNLDINRIKEEHRPIKGKLSFKEKAKRKWKRNIENKKKNNFASQKKQKTTEEKVKNSQMFSNSETSGFEIQNQSSELSKIDIAEKTIPKNFRESMVKVENQKNSDLYQNTPDTDKANCQIQSKSEKQMIMDSKATPNHKHNIQTQSRNKLKESDPPSESFLESSLKIDEKWKTETELSATGASENRTTEAQDGCKTDNNWKSNENLGENRESFFDLVKTQKKERDSGTTAKKKKTIINPNIITNNFSFKFDKEGLQKNTTSKALFQQEMINHNNQEGSENLTEVQNKEPSDSESIDLTETCHLDQSNTNPKISSFNSGVRSRDPSINLFGIQPFGRSNGHQSLFGPINILDPKDEVNSDQLNDPIEDLEENHSQCSDKKPSDGNIFRFFDQDRSLNQSLNENSGFEEPPEISEQKDAEDGFFSLLGVSRSRVELDDSRGFESYSNKTPKERFQNQNMENNKESEFRNRIRGSLSRLGETVGFGTSESSNELRDFWNRHVEERSCVNNFGNFNSNQLFFLNK